METSDDVTVRRDDVRAALRLLSQPGRPPEPVVWLLPGPEPGTLTLAHGAAQHVVGARGTWGTPADVNAHRFRFLFQRGHLPAEVRITMFGGVCMIGGTVIEPGAASAPTEGVPFSDPPSPQGELFPPAVMRALAPHRPR
jgi:hypothetical protein